MTALRPPPPRMAADLLAAAAGVITVSIAIAIGTIVLGSSAESGIDCSRLAGALPPSPAGYTTVNTSTTTNVASTCYRIVLIPTTTYTPQTVTNTTWSIGKAQCIANGTDASACNAQRATEIARLSGAGYQNLKTIGGCEPSIFRAADGYIDGRTGLATTNASTFEGTAVARSMPNSTYANSTQGYCFGRAWVAGPSLVYITAWSIQTNTTTTIQIPHTRNVPTNQSYACTVPVTTYSLINVTVPGTGSGGAVPNSWSATCYAAQEQAAAGYRLMVLVIVIVAAVAVIATVRLLTGGSGGGR